MPAKRKQERDRDTFRSREFVFILYTETPEADLLYLKLTSYQYTTVGIFHDKDTYVEDVIDEESGELLHKAGELKKAHYHFYIRFRNPRYISGVASELGIDEHLIQFCDSYRAYVEYILHWGKHGGAGKYTYEIDDLIGSLTGNAKQLMLKEPTDLKFDKIYRFIRSYNGFLDYATVYEWSYKNGYSGLCVSRYNVILEFIYEHNRPLYKNPIESMTRKG